MPVAAIERSSVTTVGTANARGLSNSTELRSGDSRGAQILVVEDDDLVRIFAVKLIESLGYAVTNAGNGMEAMRVLEETSSIELIFTDIVMPGVDGIVLADMVKRRRPQLKVLYATGYRDIARARNEAGILHGKILEKPYRPAELEREIRELLPDRKRNQAADRATFECA